jgi:hypothetical protein
MSDGLGTPNVWRRDPATGVYRHRYNTLVTVATYCDCGRNCAGRWAVYVDDEHGCPASVDSEQYPYLAEAKRAGDRVAVELFSRQVLPWASSSRP